VNFDNGVPEHSVTISVFFIWVVSVLIIKVMFGFKIHTDMFPFLSQGEHHIQANCCQYSMRIVP
jgi:hypothetical protein